MLLQGWCGYLEGVGLGEGVGDGSCRVGYGDLGQELVVAALGTAHHLNLHSKNNSIVDSFGPDVKSGAGAGGGRPGDHPPPQPAQQEQFQS